MIELYIKVDGTYVKADIGADTTVTYNKELSSVTNPSVVQNSFSLTVTLPRSEANDKIYREYWSLQRIEGTGLPAANSRMPFRLVDSDSSNVLEEGYVKLGNVSAGIGTESYEVTLFGSLGDILYSLSYDANGDEMTLADLTYDTAVEGAADSFFGTDGSFEISAALVDRAWNYINNKSQGGQVIADDAWAETINWMVAHNGVPENDNFEPTIAWVDSENKKNSLVIWENGGMRICTEGVYVDVEESLLLRATFYQDKIAPIINAFGNTFPGAKGTYPAGEVWNCMVNGSPKSRSFPDTQDSHLFSQSVWQEAGEHNEKFAPTYCYTGAHSISMHHTFNVDFGKLTYARSLTDLEARDLRSYLQRPVISIKKIIEAIGRYLSAHNNAGYTLSVSEGVQALDSYKNGWITLSLLSENDPTVQSWSVISKTQFFKNTSSPAKYLISWCKMFGIYLHVDTTGRTLSLMTREEFYTGEKGKIDVDYSSLQINPISFDKASYTFDFAESKWAWMKAYNDTYLTAYGSKRVKTGYCFGQDKAAYIENGVLKCAPMVTEQSEYFRSNILSDGGENWDWPKGVSAKQSNIIEDYPKYELFKWKLSDDVVHTNPNDNNYDSIDNVNDTVEGYMHPQAGGYSPLYLWGYIGTADTCTWQGLQAQRWQFSYPLLQLHGDDNKEADCKDVLVYFNGMAGEAGFKYSGYKTKTSSTEKAQEDRNIFVKDNSLQVYTLSDDIPNLRQFIGGKNAWYDIDRVTGIYAYATPSRLTQVTYPRYIHTDIYGTTQYHFPLFGSAKYNYNKGENYSETNSVYPVHRYDHWLDDSSSSSPAFTTTGNVTATASVSANNPGQVEVAIAGNPTSWQCHFTKRNASFIIGHEYMCVASMYQMNTSEDMSFCPRPYDISSYTEDIKLVNNKGMSMSVHVIETGAGAGINSKISLVRGGPSVSDFTVNFVIAIDLTQLGLTCYPNRFPNRIYIGNNPSALLDMFGFKNYNTYNKPYISKYNGLFAVPQLSYVPSVVLDANAKSIYDAHWKDYISDLYSTDTRILSCRAYLPDLHGAFRKFYEIDSQLWAINKISEYDYETHICKLELVRINDIQAYRG